MEKLDILLWIVGGGFGLMGVMWHSLNQRIDKLDGRIDKQDGKIDRVEASLSQKIDRVEASLSQKIDQVESNLSKKIDKLDEKLTDVDRRLCRLEGAFSTKDCCMLKDDQHHRKAE